MQFVGSGIFAVGAYGGEKVGIVVEVAGELMGIAFVEVFLKLGVPWQSLVAVEGVSSADAYVGEARVFVEVFQTAVDFVEYIYRCSVPIVVAADTTL